MPGINANPDVLDFTPTLVVLLRDGFTGERSLAGEVTVNIGLLKPLNTTPQKPAFVFVKLANGNYLVKVRSADDEPYYLPTSIALKLPFVRPLKSLWPQPPVWNGYPDLYVADPDKTLDDPEQTATYRAQLEQTTLAPAIAYPFPTDATLVRGTVTDAGAPKLNALVTNDLVALTGAYAVTVVNPSGANSPSVNLNVVNTPVIDAIEPSTMLAGTTELFVEVRGSGFDPQAVVHFDGVAVTSDIVSSAFIRTQLTAAQVAVAGAHSIAVIHPNGATSNAVNLAIATSPAIASIEPTIASAGSATMTVAVHGTGFQSDSIIELNNTSSSTVYVSSTALRTDVPAALLAAVGQVNIMVTTGNAGPSSGTIPLKIVATPVIQTLEPQTAIKGTSAFPLTIRGSGFAAGAKVTLNALPMQATVVSATEIVAQIPAAQIVAVGALPVQVTNPPATASNVVNLTVAANPVISSVDPTTVAVDSASFTVVIRGDGFMPAAQIQLNGEAQETTFISSQELHGFAERRGYRTGADGAFVLFFDDVAGSSRTEKLIVTHPDYPNPKVLDITVLRGATVSANVDMAS